MSLFNHPGVGPENLEGDQSASAGLVCFPAENFNTPILDITQPLSNLELIPARLGHLPVFFIATSTWTIISKTGTQTVPMNVRAGQNATKDNFFTGTSLSNADANAANPPCFGGLGASIRLNQMVANMPVLFDITSGAQGTGGFSCLATLSMIIWWYPVG